MTREGDCSDSGEEGSSGPRKDRERRGGRAERRGGATLNSWLQALLGPGGISNFQCLKYRIPTLRH